MATGSKARADFFGFKLEAYIEQPATAETVATGGRLVFIGSAASAEALDSWCQKQGELFSATWLLERLKRKRGEAVLITTAAGPVWLLQAAAPSSGATPHHDGLLKPSAYAQARDLVGSVANAVLDYRLQSLAVETLAGSDEERRGLLVGLELAMYRYRLVRQPEQINGLACPPSLALADEFSPHIVTAAAAVGVAVNLARHLVNVPAAELHPQSYAQVISDLFGGGGFAGDSEATVEVWTGKRLEKERCGLLLAVGQGAAEGPALVHVRYRPKGKTRLSRPLAFVGKGVTFDTGGLDIKGSPFMRLMKKDMGGSASLLGLAYWVCRTQLDVPMDFYFALAENSVDQASFRPGDVITARNGQTVEIDNTDAEGRLVMADAFDVAVNASGQDAPLALFDLATLTGAMRVALGTRIAGMFATDDQLASALLQAGQSQGDPLWRMPLFGEYATSLKSTVADVANSGTSRFGGAITAALFLERFVADKCPWVHIDLYAWHDAPLGAITEPGGNGQCIQALAAMLQSLDGSQLNAKGARL